MMEDINICEKEFLEEDLKEILTNASFYSRA